MAIKQKLKNPLIQQYILEILLPLVGYFFFDWSITIIAAFYLIDFFCAEIARNRRVFKVYKHDESNSPVPLVLSIVGGTIMLVISFWWVWLMVLIMNIDYEPELMLELEEFAIEELWLLLPIVYLVYHFKDVMTFYMPRKFTTYDYKKMVKFQLIELAVLTTLIVVGTFLWVYLEVGDIVAIISFIVIKLGFDILLARTLDAKYQKT